MTTPMREIRQILMNEMGLTRTMVREVVRDTVRELASEYFSNGEFQKFVHSQVSSVMKSYDFGSDRLNQIIAAAVSEAIKKHIVARLKIEVSAQAE